MQLSQTTLNDLWNAKSSYELGDTTAGYYITPALAARIHGLGRDHVGCVIEIWQEDDGSYSHQLAAA